MKRLILTTILSLGIFLLLQIGAEAATISVDIDRTYTVVEKGDKVRVEEIRTVKNITSDKIITAFNNSETFTITPLYSNNDSLEVVEEMSSSARVFGENSEELNTTLSFENDIAEIKVNYPRNLNPGDSYRFAFRYTNTQLAQKSGALNDIFLQSFKDDIKFETNDYISTYKTTIKIPSSFPEVNFVTPNPVEQFTQDGFDWYRFDQQDLVGNFVWIQRGIVQYYEFEITQELPRTETSNTGNKNEFRMILPRNLEGIKTTQDVYYSEITPEPKYVETDTDGNIVGVFEVLSNVQQTVKLKGYALVSVDNETPIENAGDISLLSDSLGPQYTSAAEFWEVNSSDIIAKSVELKGDSTDIHTIIADTYEFIVDSIDYSEIKRFGINERQGALKTLNGGAAVCMEYSDLYITLLRAQGIPARAAFGYGYDSKDPADQQELHQWVQVYYPAQNKWLNVDPTWGESGPALIGGDMNHFLTHVASLDPNTPATLSARTYGSVSNLEEVNFSINVREEVPDISNMIAASSLVDLYPKQDENSILEATGDYFFRLRSGLNSISTEGINLSNGSQVLLYSTLAIFGFGFSSLGYLIRKTWKS